jgi:hypothetical protein
MTAMVNMYSLAERYIVLNKMHHLRAACELSVLGNEKRGTDKK